MVYEWARGAHMGSRIDGSAQAVGERIEQIQAANGGSVTPELLVDDARADESPLHEYFEWNDSAAAAKYRVDQARLVLRMITVSVTDDRRVPVRAFVAVERSKEEGRRYIGVHDAMADENARKQLLAAAVREVQSWRQRYTRLQELAKVFEQVDQLELPKSDEVE